jgi:hypothetical protein
MMNSVQSKSSRGSLPTWLEHFLSGDNHWGLFRLIFLIALSFMLIITSYFIHGFGRYLIVPFFAVVLAFMGGTRFIQDIYELEKPRFAFRYLFSSVFGIFYPKIHISGGRKALKSDEVNMLDIIGGPGYVFIQPGNAVLFEGQSVPLAIFSAGTQFVPRFERIQPIALEDQYGDLEGISAMTRDGFDVRIKHTRFRFRLLADRKAALRNNPYPFAESAILDMHYNRTVSAEGLDDWSSGVAADIRKVISGYINRNTLDHLTAPEETGANPRGEIKRQLFSQEIAGRLRQKGTELLSVDISSFEIPNKQVDQQRLNTWQAKWMGDARLTRSYGEAQHLAYQEIGRAEAQAEMLISIMHSLSDLNLRSSDRQSLRDMILVRTAQLIDTMGEGLTLREGKKTPR